MINGLDCHSFLQASSFLSFARESLFPKIDGGAVLFGHDYFGVLKKMYQKKKKN